MTHIRTETAHVKVAKFAMYVAGGGYVGMHKKKDVEKQLHDMAQAAFALGETEEL